MSHVATVEIEIRDLDALAAACNRIGLELRRDQTAYRWYGRWMNDYQQEDAAYLNGIKPEDYGKCLHAIGIKGDTEAYEVGVVARPDGKPGFTLVWDFFDQTLLSAVGEHANKLKQAYALEVAKRQALKQGFQVQEKKLQNGSMQLALRK